VRARAVAGVSGEAHLHAVAPVTRAEAHERRRLVELFKQLCEIESPSLSERRVADAVVAELRDIGLEPEEDASAAVTGSDAGNLLARVPAPEGAPTVLLCAHLDTVPLAAPVEVIEEEGMLTNRHPAILGADDKAAVATFLALARHAVADPPPVGIELLFTTAEERGLAGARAFDRSLLRAEVGFVFDRAGPVGELVVASPTLYGIDATFIGRAAHAGLRPEDGRNAIAAAARAITRMPLGRLDDRTTANLGRITGGSAVNVVAERCEVELEVRSLDDDRAGQVVTEIVDALTEGASDGQCDVETRSELGFRGYRLARGSAPVAIAQRALESLGIEPRLVTGGGGSDVNVLQAAGLPCLNLGYGAERNHQPDEAIAVASLEAMLDVGVALLEQAA
jgi:tripeptide aminopeptidase